MKRLIARLWLPTLLHALLAGCSAMPAAITGDAADAYAMHREAEAAHQEGDDVKSERLLQGLLRVAPNDAETWFRLANLYARSDRPEQAAEAYQRSLMIKPHDARAWHNLGVIRQRQAAAAMMQAHSLAADDEALRSKAAQVLQLLEQAQGTQGSAKP
ncbi:tetratricopeptide repeat protein [Chitinimonas viridis]|uniref:Tetratricopeptide repeat protein n=1 Tax=Chitinimonas viridis TaxID=664880 RepID=A0ABT8BBY2_9NEIS|nr:tetratricopeptide repeat protein [Chitinimonas viridis]MDN3578969.1 tetratricopeptide repeat protein [Chitinimonas viridis]